MKITKINPSNIKVGDEVEDITIGKGIVERIDEKDYPLCVKFENYSQVLRYTINGFLQQSDVRPSIYLKIEDDEIAN